MKPALLQLLLTDVWYQRNGSLLHSFARSCASCVFMPGRDGSHAQPGADALQGLVRQLHRTGREGSCPWANFPPRRSCVANEVERPYNFEYCAGTGESVSSPVINQYIWGHDNWANNGGACGAIPHPKDGSTGDALAAMHLRISSCFWMW